MTPLSTLKIAAAALALVLMASGWVGFAWERNLLQDLRLAVEAQKTQAADQLAAATAKTAAIEQARDDLNLKIEADHAQHQVLLSAAAADNQRLADDIDRLRRQSPGGTGGHGAVPVSPRAAAQSAGARPGGGRLGQCEALLVEGSGLLSAVADQSDQAALMAEELKVWAK